MRNDCQAAGNWYYMESRSGVVFENTAVFQCLHQGCKCSPERLAFIASHVSLFATRASVLAPAVELATSTFGRSHVLEFSSRSEDAGIP